MMKEGKTNARGVQRVPLSAKNGMFTTQRILNLLKVGLDTFYEKSLL